MRGLRIWLIYWLTLVLVSRWNSAKINIKTAWAQLDQQFYDARIADSTNWTPRGGKQVSLVLFYPSLQMMREKREINQTYSLLFFQPFQVKVWLIGSSITSDQKLRTSKSIHAFQDRLISFYESFGKLSGNCPYLHGKSMTIKIINN